jgi:hypothetical protein
MKYRYVLADVRLSETHTQRVLVAEWELPVLQAVHGTSVKQIETQTVSREKEVDAADEFTRLADRYGADAPDQPPYIAAIYGIFGPGVAALEKAIKAATVQEPVADAEGDLDPLLADTA